MTNYTGKLSLAMSIAKEESRRQGNDVCGSELFVLGILAEGTSFGAKALCFLGLTIPDVKQAIECNSFQDPEQTQQSTTLTRQTAYTLFTSTLLHNAPKEARSLKDDYTSTEHFLLAAASESESALASLLANFEIPRESLTKAVLFVRKSAEDKLMGL